MSKGSFFSSHGRHSASHHPSCIGLNQDSVPSSNEFVAPKQIDFHVDDIIIEGGTGTTAVSGDLIKSKEMQSMQQKTTDFHIVEQHSAQLSP